MDTGGPFGLEAGQLLTEEVDEEKDLPVILKILLCVTLILRRFLGIVKKLKKLF